MSRRLERERLSSELATVEDILGSSPPEDVVGRISLNARRERIREALNALEADVGKQARAALLFGGGPVVGNVGVDADFAGRALSRYEDLVTKVWASAQHGSRLGRSGPVPDKQAARLHITGLVHGSFGFELTELSDSPALGGVPLREAVERTTQAIISAAEDDDALADVADTLGDRALVALREFFSHLKKSHASLRIVSEEHERALSIDAVSAAADRTSDSQIREEEVSIRGTFSAVLPETRRFEFRTEKDELLMGRVDDELEISQLREMNRKFVDRACTGRFFVVTLSRSSGSRRARYVLIDLRE